MAKCEVILPPVAPKFRLDLSHDEARALHAVLTKTNTSLHPSDLADLLSRVWCALKDAGATGDDFKDSLYGEIRVIL